MSAIALYNQVASSVGRAPAVVFNNLHRVQHEYIAAFSPYRARYEDLLDGGWDGLESYLELELSVSAEVPEEYSRVVRSRGYGDWRHWLNEEDVTYINANWGSAITSLGYELGRTANEQVISKSSTLEYVGQFNPGRS